MIPIITLILLLYFPSNGLGTKVFKFKEGSTDNNTLSSATLVNASEAPLPDHFVICSSHKQQQVDTINANNIYGFLLVSMRYIMSMRFGPTLDICKIFGISLVMLNVKHSSIGYIFVLRLTLSMPQSVLPSMVAM